MSQLRPSRSFTILGMILLLSLSGAVNRPLAAASLNRSPDAVSSARSVVNSLVNGQYDAVVAQFNAQLRRALPASRLAQQWQAYVQSLGAFKYEEGLDQQKAAGGTAVLVRCKMERGSVDVEVTYLDDGTIGNLTIGAANFGRHIKPPT